MSVFGLSAPGEAWPPRRLWACPPWARRLTDTTSLVTASPLFDGIDLDDAAQFVVGGHDIRRTSYAEACANCTRDRMSSTTPLIAGCQDGPGEMGQKHSRRHDPRLRRDHLQDGGLVGGAARLDTAPSHRHASRPICAISRRNNKLDQVVVVNVSSTEPPFTTGQSTRDAGQLSGVLDDKQSDIAG